MSRLSLPRVTALAAVLGAIQAARLPGFPPEIGAALGLVAVWRLVGGGSGRALLPRRIRLGLGAVGALLGIVVFHDFAARTAAPLVGMLVLVTVAQALCLIARQVSFVVFLVLLLSTTHVAGAAFGGQPDGPALIITTAYFVSLTWALVLFERRTAARRPTRRRGTVRRIVIGRPDILPAAAVSRTVLGLTVLGIAGGLFLYLVVPRSPFEPSDTEASESAEAAAAPAQPDEWSLGSAEFTHRTGPGEKGIRLGDIGRIKRDLTPYFEVELPPGRGVRLRENTYGVYQNGDWGPIRTDVPDPWEAHPDPDDDGWIPMLGTDDLVRGYDVRVTIYRGPQRRLYLAGDPVRVRLLRGTRALGTRLVCLANGQIDSVLPLLTGDVVQERAVGPESDPEILERARSGAEVAPRAEFVALPSPCRPLEEVAASVVGTEQSPWRRALLLEAWLRSEAFTFTLQMPEVDSRTPVVDFVLRARRGHCEYFASSLTLLLRALGHPARIVRGFRGGDWQEGRRTWLVRGVHYHAWTEMYLEGLGWIPLDATPPDREAVDAVSVTREAGRRKQAARSFAEALLGFGPEQRRALREALAVLFERFVREPLAFVFSARGGYAGFVLLFVVLALALRRRRRQHAANRAGFSARKLPPGAYGKALALLARRGFRRRRTQTAREFETSVGRLLPAATPPLIGLTRLYEDARFGGRAPDGQADRVARQNLDALATATRRDKAPRP